MTASLIEKLEAQIAENDQDPTGRRAFHENDGLKRAIAIVRQHEAEQPKASAEVVELLQVAATKACEIAAELVRLDGLPSDDASDYQAKVPKRVLADIELSHKSQIVRGNRLKIGCYDRIKAAIAALQAAPVADQPQEIAAAVKLVRAALTQTGDYPIKLARPELELIERVLANMGDASLRKDEEVSAPADASPTSPASDWIDWHGGTCPVLPDTLVEVVYRDSPEVIEGPIRAKAASELWSGQNDGDDIICYRIVREGEQP